MRKIFILSILLIQSYTAISMKPVVCAYCKQNQPSLNTLSKHVSEKHPLFQHECLKCNKKFVNHKKYQMHTCTNQTSSIEPHSTSSTSYEESYSDSEIDSKEAANKIAHANILALIKASDFIEKEAKKRLLKPKQNTKRTRPDFPSLLFFEQQKYRPIQPKPTISYSGQFNIFPQIINYSLNVSYSNQEPYQSYREKPYKCRKGCDRRFIRTSNRTRHERIHENQE